MANLPGIDNYVEIRAFRGIGGGGEERYRRIISRLIDNGHSFAVHGGRLYLSVSAQDRLLEEGLLTDG